jgi:replicative DNA helicase
MIEKSIFNGLLNDEEYVRKTIPYLKEDYFSDLVDKKLFLLFKDYYEKYTSLPSKDALLIELSARSGLSDEQVSSANEVIKSLVPIEEKDREWLVETTEKFCQEKAVYNAIMDSIQIIDNKGSEDKGAIPQLLSDALSVSFDTHIGHDFIEDATARHEFYNAKEVKIPFDIDLLNKVTKGGLSTKTLNIALAGTGVGKSLFMCHCAAANLVQGRNVLYITLEMAEEKIAERIDANLLNVTMDELKMLPKDAYDKKIERVSSKTKGKLIVKEYPTASAHTGHFRHLLNELKLKKGFKPDIIYVDYLNICSSARIKGAAVNSYTYVKAIAEELRGLAVEWAVPIVSATQTTRSGYTNTDVGLEDTSESFGLPATADFMFAIISTEELEDMAQVMFKQLKNRYSDPNYNKRFVVGIDRAKMRLYDVEQNAQEDIVDDGPAFDNSHAGQTIMAEKFNGFK